MLKECKTISHSIEIEFECPTKNEIVQQNIVNPSINEGSYYSDWTYQYIEVKCSLCNSNHKFEIM